MLTSTENKTEQTTFEIRFASDSDRRASYVVGAFYLDDEHKGSAQYDGQGLFGPPTAVVLPPAPNTQLQHTDNTGWSWALFGQTTFSLTDAFRLTAVTISSTS